MATKKFKALNAWIDDNIMDTIEYANGRMASLKGAYTMSVICF